MDRAAPPFRELRIERTEVENFPGVAYRLHNCDYELIDVRATNLMRGSIITRYNCLGYIKNRSIIDSGDDAWAHMANEPDAPETSIHEGRGCTIEGGVFQRRYPTELGSDGTPHACRFEYVNVNSPEIHGVWVRDDGHPNDPPYDIYGSATVTIGEGLDQLRIQDGLQDVDFQLVPPPAG